MLFSKIDLAAYQVAIRGVFMAAEVILGRPIHASSIKQSERPKKTLDGNISFLFSVKHPAFTGMCGIHVAYTESKECVPLSGLVELEGVLYRFHFDTQLDDIEAWRNQLKIPQDGDLFLVYACPLQSDFYLLGTSWHHRIRYEGKWREGQFALQRSFLEKE